jgi:hypothetical protein
MARFPVVTIFVGLNACCFAPDFVQGMASEVETAFNACSPDWY